MRITNVVVDAVSATTTDHFALVNRVLYLGETAAKKRPFMNFLDIKPESLKKKAATAETLQVDTYDTTSAVLTTGTHYAFEISQMNPADGSLVTRTITFDVPATVTTRALLSAYAVTQINAMDALKVTAAVSTNDFTVTAQTGYAIFHSRLVEANGVTVSTTTAGVYPYGKTPYYDLQKWGLTSSDYAGSTAGYTSYTWTTYNAIGGSNSLAQAEELLCNLWINTDDGDAAALITAIDAVWAVAAYNRETVELTIG